MGGGNSARNGASLRDFDSDISGEGAPLSRNGEITVEVYFSEGFKWLGLKDPLYRTTDYPVDPSQWVV